MYKVVLIRVAHVKRSSIGGLRDWDRLRCLDRRGNLDHLRSAGGINLHDLGPLGSRNILVNRSKANNVVIDVDVCHGWYWVRVCPHRSQGEQRVRWRTLQFSGKQRTIEGEFRVVVEKRKKMRWLLLLL